MTSREDNEKPPDGEPVEVDSEEEELPLALAVCSECGAVLEADRPEDLEAEFIFGQTFCRTCVASMDVLLLEMGNRYKRATRRIKKKPSSRRTKQADPEDEVKAGLAELARSFGEEVDADGSPTPPPLPRRIDVRQDLDDEVLTQLDRLLAKGKEEESLALVMEAVSCTDGEAQRALETYTLSRPAVQEGGGLFGFARSLGKSTMFRMNVARRKWDKVLEDGEDLLKADPDSLPLLTTLGEAHLETGDPARAETLLSRAVDLEEASFKPHGLLAELYRRQGRWQEARDALRVQARAAPRSEGVREQLLACALELQDHEDALSVLDDLESVAPDRRLDLGLTRVEVLYRLGRYARAFALLGDLLALEEKPHDRVLAKTLRLLDAHPGNVRGLNLAARIYEERKDDARALAFYEEYLEKTPDSVKTLRKCAFLAEREGQWGKAIWYSNLVLENNPEMARTRRKLSRLLIQAGEIEEAVDHLLELRRLKPESEPVARDLADCYVLGGEVENAVDALRPFENETLVRLGRRLEDAVGDEAVSRAVDDLDPHPRWSRRVALADAFEARGLPGLALPQLMAAYEAGPEGGSDILARVAALTEPALLQRHVLLFLDHHRKALPDPETALDLLRRYCETVPQDGETTRLLLRRLQEAGRHDEVLDLVDRLLPYGGAYAEDLTRACEALLEAGVGDPRVPLYLGRLCEVDGELWKASRHLSDYLKRTPDDVKALETVVSLARKMGDPSSLVLWLEKLDAAAGSTTTRKLEAARARLSMGDLEEAKVLVQSVLEGDPHNSPAKRLLAEVESREMDGRIASIKERIAAQADSEPALFELGELYFQKGDFEMASKAFGGCKNHRDLGEAAREKLFACYMSLGRRKRALMCLQDMRIELKLDANTERGMDVLYRMASLYLDLDSPRRAGKLFFDIMKVDPAFRDVREKISLVEVQEELLGVQSLKAGPEREWYYERDGEASGPVALGQVRDHIADGTIQESTLVWRPGFSAWKRASKTDKIKLLFDLTHP